ncbi:hypothetical protein [Pectobacterium versatile]|uniref:hypothetical protein n=1 Tax=Pectobacterium versatile TaxID=2488639 RepID=UPI003802C144
MPRRITINIGKDSNLDKIDEYSKLRGFSRSSTVSFLLDLTVPVLDKINSHNYAAKDIEFQLKNFFEKECYQQVRSESKLTIEEHFYEIWHSHIKHPKEITDREIHEHRNTQSKMGVTERNTIREKLTGLINNFNVKKAIYIYTDRRIDNRYLIAGGISNIILTNEITFGDYLFDFSQIVCLPIFDLITFGTKETLRKHKIHLPSSYICLIPIYHTNDKAVMVPVIRLGDAPQQAKTGINIIIINPFENEVKN